jgi:hypothetical protein
MANFIKLGNRYFNTDQITDVLTKPNNDTWVEVGTETIYLAGDEARALLHYLDTHSVDAVADYTQHQQQVAFTQREKEWNRRVDEFLVKPALAGLTNSQKQTFRYWLHGDDELDEPTTEAFQRFVGWLTEQEKLENIPF